MMLIRHRSRRRIRSSELLRCLPRPRRVHPELAGGDFEILLKELLDLIDDLLALVCLDDSIKDDITEEDMYDVKTYTCASLVLTCIHASFR